MADVFKEAFPVTSSGGGTGAWPTLPTGNQYNANAAAALGSHRLYFGSPIDFRGNATASWVTIPQAVVHREEVKQRKGPNGWQKVVERRVFVDAAHATNRKLLSQVRIGTVLYTVDAITNHSADRVCLHLLRAGAMEVARPDYRMR